MRRLSSSSWIDLFNLLPDKGYCSRNYSGLFLFLTLAQFCRLKRSDWEEARTSRANVVVRKSSLKKFTASLQGRMLQNRFQRRCSQVLAQNFFRS